MENRTESIFLLALIALWVMLMAHYYWWLWRAPAITTTYLVVETWMLWCLTMISVLAMWYLRRRQ